MKSNDLFLTLYTSWGFLIIAILLVCGIGKFLIDTFRSDAAQKKDRKNTD